MKKYLHTYIILSLLLSFSSFAQFDGIPTGSGYYINKLIPSPSGNDLTNEYIEIRGGADEVVPNDLYLIVIEGDGESSSLGKVAEAIKLGDGSLKFGSNGILVLIANYTDENTSVKTTSPYTTLIDSDATVLAIELSGSDVTSSSSSAVSTKTPDIGYDGNLSDETATYMLVSSNSSPKSKYIDGPSSGQGLAADGVIDSSGDHTSWILYDSYSILDDDGSEYAAGLDIFTSNTETVVVQPLSRAVIPTGLSVEWDDHNYYVRIAPRSGLSVKNSIDIGAGVIDWDYRGEIKVIIYNHGNNIFTINNGDRIAQMILAPIVKMEFEETNNLPETIRGEEGFGSTGKFIQI